MAHGKAACLGFTTSRHSKEPIAPYDPNVLASW